MDYIELKNMKFHALHGVMEQEKTVGSTFTVTLKLYLDLNAAGQSDCLADTLNYNAAFEIVKREMAIPSGLLEHAAYRIIHALEQAFPQMERIQIRLAKMRPPVNGEVEEVAVAIERYLRRY
jgi:dihydroneopterin aldolase